MVMTLLIPHSISISFLYQLPGDKLKVRHDIVFIPKLHNHFSVEYDLNRQEETLPFYERNLKVETMDLTI